ncbi:efflux RND transporter permease subunit [Flammeovirga pectinis]|uniref:Efflux RND transporter permease subunit n=1 Tax=Flammeovirga pectinis TaxID=2494373 RepID=A0A3Q9FVS0_9BACT|nr:efflux RND transporter permease subunit [Flammeovirga pectinis]AZQ65530.1 efflux RND transporter permease subunit [Flammeovirga pectinis]
MLQKFISRPILSGVISVITVILGVIGLKTIPVSQYPEIAPPTVEITTSYPGANAQTIIESVIAPIEEQINGVEGMKYMTSTANSDGSAKITVIFNQGIDPDIAAVNVQNRASRANAILPQEVIRYGVTTQKTQNSALMYLSIVATSDDYDETFLQNYANINVIPELKRISGVSKIDVYGSKSYTMRIWLNPSKMAIYGLIPEDIRRAVTEQSREAAPGSLGQNTGQSFEYVLRYKGRFKDERQYENVIVFVDKKGNNIYLKDVAKVELGALSYSLASQENGKSAVTFGVFQLPNTNAQKINEALINSLENLKLSFPNGIKYSIVYNTNDFLVASIDKVSHTLVEAFILVFLVVFIFLQDFRSTLIPAIAVPVSIIGTFFILNIIGFSMNLLTLFALILGIGIVVDDAIVVVEAIHAKLESGIDNALEASKTAMREITGSLISITLIMGAVFVPVTFLNGPSGMFYKQFGITLATAILISAINALTLSPALCALFLKPHQNNLNDIKKTKLQRFYDSFNTAFELLKNQYLSILKKLFKFKWITIVGLIISVISILWLNKVTPQGFVPSEDRSVIMSNIELPAGASLGRTLAVLEQLNDITRDFDEIVDFNYSVGTNFFSGAASSNAQGFILLKNLEERKDPGSSSDAIIQKLFSRVSEIKDANIIFFQPASIPGYGDTGGFEVRFIDKKSGKLSNLNKEATAFVENLNNRNEIGFASNSLNTNFPQYEIDVDFAKAKRFDLEVSSILDVLQGYVGSLYVTDFNKFGKPYKVYIQSSPEFRKNKNDLSSIFVKNNKGQMAPIKNFISLKYINGAQSLNRFNLYNSVTINGSINPGFSSGQTIEAIKQEAKKLGGNYKIEFSGLTREEIESSGQAPIILSISILFVFLLLAAQYESLLLPFVIILSLPIGIAGAYFSSFAFGLDNNIYFQIALVMLIGLLAKNAILIVEFSKQKRENGLSIQQAALEGALDRLRPILMTSFAFILGLLPLVFSNGVGAAGSRSIGTGAAGGLLIGTLFGVLAIPVLYIIFQKLDEKIKN